MDVFSIPCTRVVGHVVVGLGTAGTTGAAQVPRMPGYQRMEHMTWIYMLVHIHPTFYKLKKQTFTFMMQLVIYVKGMVHIKLHFFLLFTMPFQNLYFPFFVKQKRDVKQKLDGDLYCQGLKAP